MESYGLNKIVTMCLHLPNMTRALSEPVWSLEAYSKATENKETSKQRSRGDNHYVKLNQSHQHPF